MTLAPNGTLFLGNHTNRIDAKGRVSLPASFRTVLSTRGSQGVVLFRSPVEPAIEGVTVERMARLYESLDSMEPYSEARNHLEMVLFGDSTPLQLDPEGRFSVQRSLLDEVKITSEVTFLGRGATFQIWEPGTWAARRANAVEAVRTGTIPFPKISAGVL
jgi:MraZ protein